MAGALETLEQDTTSRQILLQKLEALGTLCRPNLVLEQLEEMPMLNVLTELRAWQLCCDLVQHGTEDNVFAVQKSTMWVCAEGAWTAPWIRCSVKLHGIIMTLHPNDLFDTCYCDVDIRGTIVSKRDTCSAEPEATWRNFAEESCFVLHCTRGNSIQTLYFAGGHDIEYDPHKFTC